MDQVYEAAVKRLDEIDTEAKELRTFIDLYRATRERLGLYRAEAEPGTKEQMVVGEAIVEAIKAVNKARVTDNPKPSQVAEATKAILLEGGKPLTRREIHKALGDRGLVIRGADPVKTLGTMLWRAGLFEQVEGGGYWIKDAPHAPEALSDTSQLSGSAVLLHQRRNLF